ncbi:Endogenous retrovirus group K member 13-1 Env polyprotein [Lemmus lemmus]
MYKVCIWMNQAKNDMITGSRHLAWGDGGISDNRIALLTDPTAIQTHIWKIVAALKRVQLFNGSFVGTAVSASTYKFTLFRSTNVTACVLLPYVLLVGRINFTTEISCYDCQLHSCINSSVKFNPHNQSLMILQQHTHIWLPVNLGRSWA